MAFFKDFKAFLMKGDIIALATAVVIGAAFNKIVSSVVSDIIMPIIGLLTGGASFSKKIIALDGIVMKPGSSKGSRSGSAHLWKLNRCHNSFSYYRFVYLSRAARL